jgi:hypothetical protein
MSDFEDIIDAAQKRLNRCRFFAKRDWYRAQSFLMEGRFEEAIGAGEEAMQNMRSCSVWAEVIYELKAQADDVPRIREQAS